MFAGEFALKMNEKWLSTVWFLRGVEDHGLHVSLSLLLINEVRSVWHGPVKPSSKLPVDP